MSKFQDGPDINLKANSASSPAYRVVGVATTGDFYAGICITATSHILGISQEDASSTGEAWKVRKYGTSKAACGASVSAGSILTFQTDTGKVILATITDNTTTSTVPKTVGIALQAGSTNSVIEISIEIVNLRKEASA